ncbi:MAG: MBL fold metallo-hydrolase [Erysipelotrichaceae bacterium]|nr:MBL fold metallo-hydrolase [Erysipelotrichaceae bacterium]
MGLLNIGISVSEQRIPEVQNVVLSKNTKLSSWGAVYLSVVNSDFFPSSFRIQYKNMVIYVDPLKIESGDIADYILITHGHPDHFSLADIERIRDAKTKIICPKKVAKKLFEHNIRMVRPGESVVFDEIKIDAVAAYSIGFPSHSKRNDNVGYVITIDGMRIYHAGDTDKIPELEQLDKIDVALIPIDGGNLTMTTLEAATIVNTLKPRIVIPMHYLVNKGKAQEFKRLIEEGIEVKILAE